MCGFHPIIFFIVNPIATLFQFWVHTEYIKKLLKFIENVFANPSNHRVHHGSQEKYINKNFGATFILWDRMFGTYQPEKKKLSMGLHILSFTGETRFTSISMSLFIYGMIYERPKDLKKIFFLFGNPILVARYKNKEYENESDLAIQKKSIAINAEISTAG